MNRNRKWLGALVITGMTVLAAATVPTKASVLLGSTELAGITLNLSNYAEAADDETTNEKAGIAPASIVMENSEAAAPAEEEKEEFKLNLVYDRLGIAKVDNWLNIRKEPGEDKTIIGKLPKNAGCHIYEINKDGWARIISGGVKGWVKADYLVIDEEAEEYAKKVATRMATSNTTTLNVRTLPTTDYRIYDLVGADTEMDVKKEKLTEEYVQKFVDKIRKEETEDGVDPLADVDLDAMMADLDNWVCVTLDNEKAFVHKDYVEISYKLERAVALNEVKADEANGISSTRAQMVEFAKKYLGGKYVWGGTTLGKGVDCSGFTMRIYEHFGYSIPRTSSAQASHFNSIKSSEAKPGDLFFYGSNGRVNHVAMYIGNGQVIHASNARTGIKISNANYRTPIKVGSIIK